MRINDLDKKVVGRFFKEIVIDDDNDDEPITYIFPDTKEFISVLNRKFVNQQIIAEDLNLQKKSSKEKT
jgi:hypothetical protein